MTDQRILDAFAAAPRERFLPHGEMRFAALDRPLDIGHGPTNSQPTTVRHLLELLEVEPGDRVLDVGCGSGWTTALLGHLVGPRGTVVGVEIVPELVEFGRANLAAVDLPWARIEAADPDALGRPSEAPFDRILVSAEAAELPTALVEQLREGGLLVLPVRGRLWAVRRPAGWPQVPADVVRHGHYAFVPLHEPGAHGERT
ncbi:MAG: protein-L-isoaspartate O-methyltransferase family protein [Nocardioides sp.]